ncbi:MAG: 7-cyano-7-deazaguanine synthase [Bacteroidetes bacterium]|nr:7-cyano-7-deazaguanine synthase [Bacteroidota bacterium]
MGGVSMTRVIVDHDFEKLPSLEKNVIPVQIYGIDGRRENNIATIGNSVIDNLKRLGVELTPAAFDYFTLALAVTAADTFVQRKTAADGWSREIELKLSLYKPAPWIAQKNNMEKLLHFLSGDLWELKITDGGCPPPIPYSRRSRYHLKNLEKLDCVCLFSGGVDSTVGALDLLRNGRKPLLVSHSYTHDKSLQDAIAGKLKEKPPRFSINAYPRAPQLLQGSTDISMRTRSFNFFALGVIGGCAISKINKLKQVELFVPENGFISLNAPLTSRRIGSLSTKTTHPYYVQNVQSLFEETKINVALINPYQFKTKGEMLKECADQKTLREVIQKTVSCSNWKRKGKQCGRCVPCLIRRAAFASMGFCESNVYLYENLATVLKDEDNRDDLFALISAINRVSDKTAISWLLDSGPLSSNREVRDEYKKIFIKGLNEVKTYLKDEGLIE